MSKSANKLINETSPYLLQHAYNPVNWYPWGPESLQKAKNEDKPILVSIGYSACHWCHVMERESFENETLAALMNRDFVCIKIDREERPDIDQIYMEAVQAMGINGGWPLNVFLTPDQKPFYGGTYFPPPSWAQVLQNVAKAFYGKREKLEESAEQFAQAVGRSEVLKYGLTVEEKEFDEGNLQRMFDELAGRFDTTLGGTKKSPKFPMPSIWRFLLLYYFHSEDPKARDQLILTLDSMAKGGIYDQVVGGFARYSVDAQWFAPHFEKMLYDNGQLLTLYAEAYILSQKPLYKQVLLQTVEWLTEELKSPENAFYSALDADSEGVEGKFYTWTYEELLELVDHDASPLLRYFNATPDGNWEEGRNILHWTADDNTASKKEGIEMDDWLKLKSDFIQKAKNARSTRIKPGLDDKVLAGWNGIMLKGLVDAFNATGDGKILHLAIDNAHFITTKMMKDGILYRTYKNGTAKIEGYLEDYAFCIEALLALYEATLDEKWLSICQKLTESVIANFYDNQEKFFFYTSAHAEGLIARKKEIFDNVIPSSNAALAHVLYKLGVLFDNERYMDIAKTMVRLMAPLITKEPQYLSHWAILYTYLCHPTAEVAIVGPDAVAFAQEINRHYLPYKVVCGTSTESPLALLANRTAINGKTTIYVCFGKTCKLPVHTVNEALAQLS